MPELDDETKAKLEEVVAKEPDELEDEDKTFLRENADNLDDEAKEKYKDVLEEKIGDKKPDLTDDERAELEKLREKDLNFKKLRDKEKRTRSEIDKERDELTKSQQEFIDNMVRERKEDALALLVGDDKELRNKALVNYDRIKDEAKTKEEIYSKMREAVNMIGVASQPDPMARQYHGSYDRFGSNKAESDDSKGMREAMRISDEDKKKYGGDNWKAKI